jgi:hypothetical protein
LQLASPSISASPSEPTAVLSAGARGNSGVRSGFGQLMLAQLTTSLQPSRMKAGGEAAAGEAGQEIGLGSTLGPGQEIGHDLKQDLKQNLKQELAQEFGRGISATAGADGRMNDAETLTVSDLSRAAQSTPEASPQQMNGGATSVHSASGPQAGNENPVSARAVCVPLGRGAGVAVQPPASGGTYGISEAKTAKTTAPSNHASTDGVSAVSSPALPDSESNRNVPVSTGPNAALPAPAANTAVTAMAASAAETGTPSAGKAASAGHERVPSRGGSAGSVAQDPAHSLSGNRANPLPDGQPAGPRPVMVAEPSRSVAAAEGGTPAQHIGPSDAETSNVAGGVLLHGLPATFSTLHTGVSTATANTTGTGTAGDHNAFERMDAAPPPQMLTGGPQRLAVGVRDAGLGWVEVRTHTAAGQVSAVVATTSAEAHTALSAELPAMREYLAAQHVRVDTLGTQQFSSPSGQEEASRGKPGGDRGGESSERVGAGIQAAAADPEEETMSYISVRV